MKSIVDMVTVRSALHGSSDNPFSSSLFLDFATCTLLYSKSEKGIGTSLLA